jgi:UDP-N-acetylglucosamine 4,6-dehydratase
MIKVLITGGTGTLGKALVCSLYDNEDMEIHIFSRDENKQKALLREYPKLICHIGDICDRDDLNRISHNKYTYIYHCAALKHVEVCEDNVVKTVKVNYSGTKNVYWCLGKHPTTKFCFFTTDKAVAPINAYGMAKGLAEKFLIEQNKVSNNIYIFRWGNILGSTGSVIPIFVDQLLNKKPITITDKGMTRFWLSIDEAVEFVLQTIATKPTGVYWPRYIRCASLVKIVEEIAKILDVQDYTFKDIGLRPGEKIHEAMNDTPYGPDVVSDSYSSFTDIDINRLLYPIVKRLVK